MSAVIAVVVIINVRVMKCLLKPLYVFRSKLCPVCLSARGEGKICVISSILNNNINEITKAAVLQCCHITKLNVSIDNIVARKGKVRP